MSRQRVELDLLPCPWLTVRTPSTLPLPLLGSRRRVRKSRVLIYFSRETASFYSRIQVRFRPPLCRFRQQVRHCRPFVRLCQGLCGSPEGNWTRGRLLLGSRSTWRTFLLFIFDSLFAVGNWFTDPLNCSETAQRCREAPPSRQAFVSRTKSPQGLLGRTRWIHYQCVTSLIDHSQYLRWD